MGELRRVVIVHSPRRSPPELFLLGLCLFTAITGLVGAQPPSSVEAVMPGWVLTGWYVALGLAGVVGMAGNLWPGHLLTGLRLRLCGQIVAAGPAAAYALAVYVYAGMQALIGGGLIVGWAAMSGWQAIRLARDVRRLGGAG